MKMNLSLMHLVKKSLSVGYIGIFYIVYISVFLWIVAGMAEEMLSFL